MQDTTKQAHEHRWIRQLGCAWGVIAWGLALRVIAAEPGGFVKELDEAGRKSDAARAIQPRFVPDLVLTPRTAAQAIEILMIQGFRCGVRAPDDFVIFKELGPEVRCTQDKSKIDPECPTLVLSLGAQWSRYVNSRAEVLDQLGSAKIKAVSANCPVPVVGPSEFVSQRKTAEQSLKQQVSELALVGVDGKQAFERLLANGFDCGIEQGDASGADSTATLVCRRLPTRIQWCFDAELLLGIRWKEPHRTPTERVHNIQAAKVESIKSQCRLPRIEGNLTG